MRRIVIMSEEHKDKVDPRYAAYPPSFHTFWPRHVIMAGSVVIILISALVTLTYFFRLPTEFGGVFPDAGANIPGPEWYFLLLFQPFWYLKGDLKGWLFIGTFVIPVVVLVFLILVPFIFRRKKTEVKTKGFVSRLVYGIVPVTIFLAVFAGIYRSGAPAKSYSCISCHAPENGERQYLPPMNVEEYYMTQRKSQIAVGKYRASKSDESGDSNVRGEVETYKDANWQLRHIYEPTFTW